MSLSAEERATHEANKREMFDAMRAYHESEIAHKQDGIRMLVTLLTATGAVFAAIIVPQNPVPHAVLLAALAALAATIGTAVIAHCTNKKIREDHEIYRNFGDEYVRECEVLGMFKPVPIGDQVIPVKNRVKIGHGSGWKHTQQIIQAIALAISLVAWLAAAYVFLTSDRHHNPAKSAKASAPCPCQASSPANQQAPPPPEFRKHPRQFERN